MRASEVSERETYGVVSRKLQTCFWLCHCQTLVVHDKDGVGIFSVRVIH